MTDFNINGYSLKELTKKGKELREHEEEVEFLMKSYVGGAEYREGEYLTRHKRENKASFKKRLENSVFTNYTSPVIDIYNGYLHREQKERSNKGLNDSLFKAYIEDADLNGRTHDKIMREVSRLSSLMGSVGILIDSPESSTGSLGSDISAGLHTYIKVYTPNNIVNLIYNYDTGRPVLDILVLNEDFDDSVYEYYVIYTNEEWFRIKQKDNTKPELISQGVHGLGIVPFIIHKNKDSLISKFGVSDVSDIAELNKRVYQLDSSAIEIIENTAFPFLEVPRRDNPATGDGDIIIGTTNVLEVDPDTTNKHRWVEPDGLSLDKILMWRNQTLEDIRYHSKIGGTDGVNSNKALSGVSLEIMFQQLNSILADKAESLENTENAIFSIIGLWNNQTWDGSIVYSRRFGVRDLSFELDQFIKASLFVDSKEFTKEMAEKVARKVLTNVDEKTIDLIVKEVEDNHGNSAGNSVSEDSLNAS